MTNDPTRNTQHEISFIPTPDTAALIHRLLDIYERRGGAGKRIIRVRLDDVTDTLPGYYSQTDPHPRLTTNEQLTELEKRGLLHLTWQPGQTGHLLEAVSLATTEASTVAPLYTLLEREPLAEQRRRLRDLLLADRFRLKGWREAAIQHTLAQLRAGKSPAPFLLSDDDWNRDLLAALIALPDDAGEEIPYRVFSVRVFNHSKRFEALKSAIATLARRHRPEWRPLPDRDVLRELGLVANPDHLYLYGPWRLVDAQGQVVSLAEFFPSVGIPSALAGRVQQVRVDAAHVVCVENLAPFYELVRYEGEGTAALCLWGNPAPSTRHLLRCLADDLPPQIPLLLWADIDAGGLRILAQLREKVSPHFAPHRMDMETLEVHAHWAQPLTAADERNLTHLKQRPSLQDMQPLIDHMLRRGIKLEQEAIALSP